MAMLNRDILINRIMAVFEAVKGVTPMQIQEERRRLHAIALDKLGKEFEKLFPKEDAYQLKA